jgi:hypothetical protein
MAAEAMLACYRTLLYVQVEGLTDLDSKSDVSDGVGACGHVVGTSGENDIGVTDENVLATVDDGLKAGSAKSVDGQGRCLLPHAASQSNVTRNVGGVDGGTADKNYFQLRNYYM